MYKLATKAEDYLVLLMLASLFCLIGQIVAILLPENLIITIVFLLSFLLRGMCGLYRTIYHKGMEATTKEQEPDEDNRRDSTT